MIFVNSRQWKSVLENIFHIHTISAMRSLENIELCHMFFIGPSMSHMFFPHLDVQTLCPMLSEASDYFLEWF